MKKISLAKAVQDELDRPTVREMQKRARKRPAVEITRSESWSKSEFPDLPPLKDMPGDELNDQFVRDEAGGFLGDGDDGTEWYQPSLPPSSPVGPLMHASDDEDAMPEEVIVNGKRYTYHPRGPKGFVDYKLDEKEKRARTRGATQALHGDSMFD